MSRIGKVFISIPKEVKVNIRPGNALVEGPKGKLELNIPSGIRLSQKDDQLLVERDSNAKQQRANHGTIRATLSNMVTGVTKGHKKELEIQGLGLRAQLQGRKIVFNLGFSHPVEFDVPESVKVTVPSQTAIAIDGPDKSAVGHVAAKIRDLKPVEPYKGKGIRYLGEVVRRKQGKSVAK